MELRNQIYNMDCLQGLRELPDNCVDCCITSPPYFNLRDYGTAGQIGLEDTPEAYIARLTEVFAEVLRVLKPTGTLWLNIGDSYAGSGKGAGKYPDNARRYKQGTNKGTLGVATNYLVSDGYKAKDLIGIPWQLAFALRSIGYYLRQDIIWCKPNPMPESVTDRCVKAHEYIFLLSKSKKYYFDYKAIQEDAVSVNDRRAGKGRFEYNGKRMAGGGTKQKPSGQRSFVTITDKRNKRDVWTISVKADYSAHFAVFPTELIRPCVLAGCPVDGLVLDPFMGSGTTAAVAATLHRNYLGFELNPDYMPIIREKVQVTPELFY